MTLKRKQRLGLRKKAERPSRMSLTIALSIFVFIILLLAVGLTALGVYAFTKFGVLVNVEGNLDLRSVILFMVLSSLIIGGLIAFFSSRLPLKPINNLINQMNRLAAGDFRARLRFGNTLSAHPTAREISTSFNTMAEELENTELLRTDFINNFSHEFKTPIVSIRGFARELQMGDLTQEQREEYTRIIVEESDRLAKLSTTVLELSRLENQQIVTGQTNFDLDEQIRRCILLLEPQWTEKELEIIPELEPLTIYSNEDITEQIWKNLIGNAVKFTPNGGTVSISMTADTERVCVTIADTGIGMSEETKAHMFEKFYQGDPSHHRMGYGIGLSVVDRAVKLCGGSIEVESEEGRGSRFTVTLPRRTMVQAEEMES